MVGSLGPFGIRVKAKVSNQPAHGIPTRSRLGISPDISYTRVFSREK